MSEWKETTLGKLAEVQTGPYGSQLKNEQYVTGGTPVVTVEHIKNFLIADFTYPSVTEQDKLRLKKYTLKSGDIIFSRVGSVDLSAFVKEHQEGWLFSSRMLRVRVGDDLNPEFLSYYLRQSNIRQSIINISVGSTMPSINTEILKSLPISYCSLNEQKQIASVLSCLDDKIENLRKQNQTLEKIAQTLFKHWFIDFEFPNENGDPYQSSGGAMQPSELGEIPEGWRVGKLEDIITVNPSESIKKGSLVKYVDMKSLSTSSMEINNYVTREFTSGSKFRNNDTLLARITPCLENGKTAFVSILDDNNEVAFGSTEFIVLRAKENCCPEYVYPLARSPYFRDFAVKNMTGSSGRQRIPNDIIANYTISIPENEIIEQYRKICHPLFRKTTANQKQIKTLTKTRDTLLPKLMSGKLRIKEEEK